MRGVGAEAGLTSYEPLGGRGEAYLCPDVQCPTCACPQEASEGIRKDPDTFALSTIGPWPTSTWGASQKAPGSPSPRGSPLPSLPHAPAYLPEGSDHTTLRLCQPAKGSQGPSGQRQNHSTGPVRPPSLVTRPLSVSPAFSLSTMCL